MTAPAYEQLLVATPQRSGALLEPLQAGKPVTFARWGDGEWRAVLSPDDRSRNCDGNLYSRRLGEAMEKVLVSRPQYLLGLQTFGVQLYKDRLIRWLTERKILDLPWIASDILHTWSRRRQLGPFIEAMRKWPVIIVGPKHLQPLSTRADLGGARLSSFVCLALIRGPGDGLT